MSTVDREVSVCGNRSSIRGVEPSAQLETLYLMSNVETYQPHEATRGAVVTGRLLDLVVDGSTRT